MRFQLAGTILSISLFLTNLFRTLRLTFPLETLLKILHFFGLTFFCGFMRQSTSEGDHHKVIIFAQKNSATRCIYASGGHALHMLYKKWAICCIAIEEKKRRILAIYFIFKFIFPFSLCSFFLNQMSYDGCILCVCRQGKSFDFLALINDWPISTLISMQSLAGIGRSKKEKLQELDANTFNESWR